MYKISVIIPTYRPQSYLWECLDSLREQTLPSKEFEVLIILNGEKEPYFSMIEKYILQNNCDNFNLFYSTEKGVSNARNVGLDNANGTYITFIDDDDYVSPNYIEELYKNSSPNTVALSNAYSFNDNTLKLSDYYITKAFNRLKNSKHISIINSRSFFSGPVYKLLHRDIISNRKFNINFSNGEDALFMFSISNKIKYLKLTNDSAIYYRRIRNNSATTASKKITYELTNNFNLMTAYTKLYLNSSKSYSFIFYLTRIAALIRHIIQKILKLKL